MGESFLSLTVQVVKRTDGRRGFKVLPRRWVVERTFACICKHRRCVRDYETGPDHHEAMVYIAKIATMSRRLARVARLVPEFSDALSDTRSNDIEPERYCELRSELWSARYVVHPQRNLGLAVSAGCHADGAVETDGLAVKIAILEYVGGEPTELIGVAEARRVRDRRLE